MQDIVRDTKPIHPLPHHRTHMFNILSYYYFPSLCPLIPSPEIDPLPWPPTLTFSTYDIYISLSAGLVTAADLSSAYSDPSTRSEKTVVVSSVSSININRWRFSLLLLLLLAILTCRQLSIQATILQRGRARETTWSDLFLFAVTLAVTSRKDIPRLRFQPMTSTTLSAGLVTAADLSSVYGDPSTRSEKTVVISSVSSIGGDSLFFFFFFSPFWLADHYPSTRTY